MPIDSVGVAQLNSKKACHVAHIGFDLFISSALQKQAHAIKATTIGGGNQSSISFLVCLYFAQACIRIHEIVHGAKA
jgi:hypothetical protein